MTTSKSKKPYLVTFTQTIHFSAKIMAASPEQARAHLESREDLLDICHPSLLVDVEDCNISGWDVEEILP